MKLNNQRVDIFFAFALPLVAITISLLLGISLIDKATGWFGISPQTILLDHYTWLQYVAPINITLGVLLFYLGFSNRLNLPDLVNPKILLGFSVFTVVIMFLSPSAMINTMTMTGFNYIHIRSSALVVALLLWFAHIENQGKTGHYAPSPAISNIFLCVIIGLTTLLFADINGVGSSGLEVPIVIMVVGIYHYFRPLSYARLQLFIIVIGSYVLVRSGGLTEATLLVLTDSISCVFLNKIKGCHLVVGLCLIILLIVLFILASPYRFMRIISFLDPWQDPFGSGYSLVWRLLAEGNGGFLGAGWGNSITPGFQSRMGYEGILSLTIEEFGIFPLLFLSIACIWFLFRGFKLVNVRALTSHSLSILVPTLFIIHSIVFGLFANQFQIVGANFPLISFSPIMSSLYGLMFGIIARNSLSRPQSKLSINSHSIKLFTTRSVVNLTLMVVAIGTSASVLLNAIERDHLIAQLDKRTLRTKIENNGMSASTVDRNGRLLSESIEANTAVIDPYRFNKRIIDLGATYQDINQVMDSPKGNLIKSYLGYVSHKSEKIDLEKLIEIAGSGKKRFRYVSRMIEQAPPEDATKLRNQGLYFIREWTRKYYENSLMHIIGMTNIDHQYMFGLERTYQEQMSAYKTQHTLRRVSAKEERIIETVDGTAGEPLQLNIDSDLQVSLNQLLQFESHQQTGEVNEDGTGPKNEFRLETARAIVMSVDTGEVIGFVRNHSVSSDLPVMAPSKIPKVEQILDNVGLLTPQPIFCRFRVKADEYRSDQPPASACQIAFSDSQGEFSADDFKGKINDWELLALFNSTFSNGKFIKPMIVKTPKTVEHQLFSNEIASQIQHYFTPMDTKLIPYTTYQNGLRGQIFKFAKYDDSHPYGHNLFGDANAHAISYSLNGKHLMVLLTLDKQQKVNDSFFRALSFSAFNYLYRESS